MWPHYKDYICKYLDTEQIEGLPTQYIEDVVTIDLNSIESFGRVDEEWTRVTMRSAWAYLLKVNYYDLHKVMKNSSNKHLNN